MKGDETSDLLRKSPGLVFFYYHRGQYIFKCIITLPYNLLKSGCRKIKEGTTDVTTKKISSVTVTKSFVSFLRAKRPRDLYSSRGEPVHSYSLSLVRTWRNGHGVVRPEPRVKEGEER